MTVGNKKRPARALTGFLLAASFLPLLAAADADGRAESVSPREWPVREKTHAAAPRQLIHGNVLNFERLISERATNLGHVSCIYQDRKGFLWFGTKDGLNKYDGYGFTVFQHDPLDPETLGNNWVVGLFEFGSEALWAVTVEGTINRIDRKTGKVKRFTVPGAATNSNELYDNNLHGHAESSRIWLALNRGDIYIFDAQNESFEMFDPTVYRGHEPFTRDYTPSNVMLLDDHGIFWVGTAYKGIFAFDTVNRTVRQYRHDEDDAGSIGSDKAGYIIQDAAGTVWVGTVNSGLHRYDREADRFVRYAFLEDSPQATRDDDITALFSRDAERLWVGMQNGSLATLDTETETFTHIKVYDRYPYAATRC